MHAGLERPTEIQLRESQSPEQVMQDFFYEMTQERLTKQQTQWPKPASKHKVKSRRSKFATTEVNDEKFRSFYRRNG